MRRSYSQVNTTSIQHLLLGRRHQYSTSLHDDRIKLLFIDILKLTEESKSLFRRSFAELRASLDGNPNTYIVQGIVMLEMLSKVDEGIMINNAKLRIYQMYIPLIWHMKEHKWYVSRAHQYRFRALSTSKLRIGGDDSFTIILGSDTQSEEAGEHDQCGLGRFYLLDVSLPKLRISSTYKVQVCVR